MNLSAKIRSCTLPQIKGNYFEYLRDEEGNMVFDEEGGNTIVGCCAVGAIRVAQHMDPFIPAIFKICPHCNERNAIESVIIHLNDHSKWTFAQIADWLEGQGL